MSRRSRNDTMASEMRYARQHFGYSRRAARRYAHAEVALWRRDAEWLENCRPKRKCAECNMLSFTVPFLGTMCARCRRRQGGTT